MCVISGINVNFSRERNIPSKLKTVESCLSYGEVLFNLIYFMRETVCDEGD